MSAWKRTCQIALAGLLAATGLMSMTAAPQSGSAAEKEISQVIFASDFNQDQAGEAPADLDVSEGGGTVRVVEVPDSSNHSIYLDDTSDKTNVIVSKSFEPLGSKVTVSFKFMQPAYTSSTKLIRLKGKGKSAVILETNGGDITYVQANKDKDPLIKVEENTWYAIQVDADFDKQAATVMIDGRVAIADAPFNSAAPYADFLESFTPNSKQLGHYIDDLSIAGSPAAADPAKTEEPKQTTGGDAAEPGHDGIYQAEDADVLEGVIIDNKHVGFTGTGFTDYSPNAPGGYLEWKKVHVPAAGEYTLTFRYAHGGTDQRPAAISVNGQVVAAELAFGPTGDWTNWVTVSTKVMLQEGDNVVQATGVGASGGANIDYMQVAMEVDQLYEAEQADVLEGVIIDNQHAGFTGTGFTDYKPNAPGGYIEWKVNVPVAGTYTLAFRYAHGGTDQRPASISVNGKVAAFELAFGPTGDWTNWKTSAMQAELKAGENVIRATAVGASGGGNIDSLRVHNKPESAAEQVKLESVALSDLLSGLQLKKLRQLGIVAAAGNPRDDQQMTRLSFMAAINAALGFTHRAAYPGLEDEQNVWEVPLEQWDAYVLEAAKDAGYIQGYPNGTLKPEETLSRQEAAVIAAGLLQLKPDAGAAKRLGALPSWSKEAITAVVEQGYMAAENGDFRASAALTVADARLLIQKLALDYKPQPDHAAVVSARAISNRMLVITLNGQFDHFDVGDIAVKAAIGSWDTLTPNLQPLPMIKAAQGVNAFGQTILVMESAKEWTDDAKFKPEVKPAVFSGDLAAAVAKADNMLTWQMDHGGFSKETDYSKPWDGKAAKSVWFGVNGEPLGMIDNDATITEIRFLAEIYGATGEQKYKDAALKGIDFLLTMQSDTGGFPQVYPKRGKPGELIQYSNYITFNDNAMINVLDLMEDAANRRYPFDGNLISDEVAKKLQASMAAGLDYILKAQIKVDGKLTGWSAQHDPVTYEARGARSYEHAALSGKEAVGIVRYLMARPVQTPEIKRSVRAALDWFDEVKLAGVRYVSADPDGEYFVKDPKVDSWYRFYEIGTNLPIFSGRDGVIKRTIQEIEQERRDGYSWGGNYAMQLLATAKTTGYFPNKIYVEVVAEKSKDTAGRTLQQGDIVQMKDLTKALSSIPSRIAVAQDGSGDYTTIQAAVDAVPNNNQDPVIIDVKNGKYKEVVTIPSDKPFITLTGENSTQTVLSFDNYASRENGIGGTMGTSGSATFFIKANDTRVENITVENTFDESMDVPNKQAVALNVRGDRVAFKNVRFLGNQDTLLTNGGTQYFEQCYMEGDVDFIFGASQAVFKDCIIHSLDRHAENNGYITAASTQIAEPYGYLFLDCKLTSDAAAGTVHLGRPWHPSGDPKAIASVVFMNTEMGDHIKSEPWADMSGFSWKDARLFEYKNTGPGAKVNDSRAQLTDEQAREWTVGNVLKGWNPQS